MSSTVLVILIIFGVVLVSLTLITADLFMTNKAMVERIDSLVKVQSLESGFERGLRFGLSLTIGAPDDNNRE